MGDVIEAYFGDGSQFGMRIQYSHDGGGAMGTGGALVRAAQCLDDEFFVLNGDSYLILPFRRIAESFRECGKKGMMIVYRNNNRFDRSNVEVSNHLVRHYERDGNRSGAFHFIDAGLSAFKKEAILNWSSDTALDLGEMLSRLAAEGQLAALETFQRFYEIGSHTGLAELRSVLGERPEALD
jgi:NDP-sugar pyrophosphorylase family protein